MTDNEPRLIDVMPQLMKAAHVALSDPHGAGMEWTRAVAAGNVHYVRGNGKRIDAKNAIVLGHSLRGKARNSFVIDTSATGTAIRARDSVVVSSRPRRVRAHGNTRVLKHEAPKRVGKKKAPKRIGKKKAPK